MNPKAEQDTMLKTTLIFLGDFCLRDNDRPALGPEAQALLRRADAVCLNFEAPITKRKMQPAPKTGPSLSQSITSADLCKEFGVTHCTLANNHMMDYGSEGLRESLLQLGDIVTMGAGFDFEKLYLPAWFEHGGKRIALFSFAEAQFGVWQEETQGTAGFAWIDHPKARSAIREAKNKADWIIVQVHAGLEMVDLPLPEWRIRYRELIDLGADLVIGHHPHVIQGSECYQGKMIHYSLGNFYMASMLEEKSSGAVLEVNISDTSLQSKFIPLKINQSLIELDETKESQQRHEELCKKLNDPETYYSEIQGICNEFWHKIYSDYYAFSLVGLGTKPSLIAIKEFVFQIGRYVLRRSLSSDANESMLLHNIRIESHRWVVERALRKRES